MPFRRAANALDSLRLTPQTFMPAAAPTQRYAPSAPAEAAPHPSAPQRADGYSSRQEYVDDMFKADAELKWLEGYDINAYRALANWALVNLAVSSLDGSGDDGFYWLIGFIDEHGLASRMPYTARILRANQALIQGHRKSYPRH